jgi:aminodeoxyfutalosine synthase
MNALLQRRLERAGLADIADKVLAEERLSRDDGLRLLECGDLHAVAALANVVRERLHGDLTYYNINRHINYSNICVLSCRFCAFGKKRKDADAYEMDLPAILKRSDEIAAAGGTEIHMVGGLHPTWRFPQYLEILRALKSRHPEIHLKAFTAIEIKWFAKLARMSIRETLQALIEAGLGSLPGGGAEILDDDVRKDICEHKESSQEWLDIHRTAHELDLKTTSTMLYGHVEQPHHRIDHMLKLRRLQDETRGLQAFIPLRFHPQNTQLADLPIAGGVESAIVHAVARLMLDNIPNIKSFWIMQGVELSQFMLRAGVNDIDGTVVEERITHMAGATTPLGLTTARLQMLIREAGRIPIERDTLYRAVKRDPDGFAWTVSDDLLPQAAQEDAVPAD